MNIAKQKQACGYKGQTSSYQWDRGWGRDKTGVGVKRYKILCIK